MTQCWYPRDTAESQRDLTASTFLPSDLKEIVFNTDVLKRVLSKECSVGVDESGTVAPQPFQLAMRDDDSNGFASSSQLDFRSSFGLVHYGGKV